MLNRVSKMRVLLICGLLLITFFFANFYLIKENKHCCSGHDCQVCSCLQVAKSICKNLLLPQTTIHFSLFLVYVVYKIAKLGKILNEKDFSLVLDKLRLNN